MSQAERAFDLSDFRTFDQLSERLADAESILEDVAGMKCFCPEPQNGHGMGMCPPCRASRLLHP